MRSRKKELLKRRRELWWALPVAVVFVVLTWVLFRFYSLSSSLPVSYALFFFGLVNINVLVFLTLMFFLGRNLVKAYTEAKPRTFGKTLKTRLFLAFISFAFIPTFIMFLVSVFYINNSFDRWFANRTKTTLERAGDLTEHYLSDVRSGAFHVGEILSKEVQSEERADRENYINNMVSRHGVDAVELYDYSKKSRLESIFKERRGFYLPPLEWGEVGDLVESDHKRSLIRKTQQGKWISSVVPVQGEKSLVVVSKVLPFTLLDTIDSLVTARSDFKASKDFKFPLKSTYLFILVCMTLVILAFGGWFSLYLAQSLSLSLFALGRATRRISQGDFKQIRFETGMVEINHLVDNFNLMVSQLEESQRESNKYLADLDKHSKYIDTVLSQISSAVVSFDNEHNVTLYNKKAFQFTKFDLKNAIGKPFHEVLPKEIVVFINQSLGADFSEEEILFEEMEVLIEDRKIMPFQLSFSRLIGSSGERLGFLLTFDDVTLLRETQRVKAWREVASRVAHEIKNPLTPVKLSAERLQRKFGAQVAEPSFRECTQTIISQVDHIKNLVNEFNQFARFPKLDLKERNFEDLIKEIKSIYSASHPEVDFIIENSHSSSPFKFDYEQMKRVFINLIENSIEAMKEDSSKSLSIKLSVDNSTNLFTIRYRDSGPGVDKMNLEKVFSSKFTTKSSGGGLGLAIVKRIVEDHGGHIRIEESGGRYSAFIIDLPFKLSSN